MHACTHLWPSGKPTLPRPLHPCPMSLEWKQLPNLPSKLNPRAAPPAAPTPWSPRRKYLRKRGTRHDAHDAHDAHDVRRADGGPAEHSQEAEAEQCWDEYPSLASRVPTRVSIHRGRTRTGTHDVLCNVSPQSRCVHGHSTDRALSGAQSYICLIQYNTQYTSQAPCIVLPWPSATDAPVW